MHWLKSLSPPWKLFVAGLTCMTLPVWWTYGQGDVLTLVGGMMIAAALFSDAGGS